MNTSSWTSPSGSTELGRFALQVKGGRYLLIDGEWYLKTREGNKYVRSCPLDETKLAALDLHDDIKECAQTVYNPYVIPVLTFPDMEPDPAIKQLARRAGVYVIWGVGNLLADLEEIVRSRRVSEALGMDRIAREVQAVTDGLIRLRKVRESLCCRCGGSAGCRLRATAIYRDAAADVGRCGCHDDPGPRRAAGGITARIAGKSMS